MQRFRKQQSQVFFKGGIHDSKHGPKNKQTNPRKKQTFD